MHYAIIKSFHENGMFCWPMGSLILPYNICNLTAIQFPTDILRRGASRSWAPLGSVPGVLTLLVIMETVSHASYKRAELSNFDTYSLITHLQMSVWSGQWQEILNIQEVMSFELI